MLYSEIVAGIYTRARDPEGQNIDPGIVDLFLNRVIRDFLIETGLFRQVALVPVVSGIAVLRPKPDVVLVSGKIIRVEDADRNNHKLFGPVPINRMDTMHTSDWRSKTVGLMQKWLWGTPKPLATSQSISGAQQDGFSTIIVYPLVATGNLNIHFIGTPETFSSDAQVCAVPDFLHDGIVDGTAAAILREKEDPTLVGYIDRLDAEYQKWVGRGKAELGEP